MRSDKRLVLVLSEYENTGYAQGVLSSRDKTLYQSMSLNKWSKSITYNRQRDKVGIFDLFLIHYYPSSSGILSSPPIMAQHNRQVRPRVTKFYYHRFPLEGFHENEPSYVLWVKNERRSQDFIHEVYKTLNAIRLTSNKKGRVRFLPTQACISNMEQIIGPSERVL